MQEQKINTTEFERGRFVSLRLCIFLTASALAGARAKKHNRIELDQSSLIDQLWSIFERDRFVSSRFVYIFDR